MHQRIPHLSATKTLWDESAPAVLRALHTKPEAFWTARGARVALRLFHEAARRIPAYKDFLKQHGVRPAQVRTIADFTQVPPTSKDGYLARYAPDELSWDGRYHGRQLTVSATSGSTGEPFYFPRENTQDLQYALTAELYLRENFAIQRRRTLYVDAFAMGVWIGGLFTYRAVKMVADRGGYALDIITPGINVPEILSAVRRLGPQYDQVLIGGYPPFVKDIVDAGVDAGIDWRARRVKFIFSAEAFSEPFRNYIARRTGLTDIHVDTLNHYGTVDLGTMAHETPLSILIRRMVGPTGRAHDAVLPGGTAWPTLAQYLPEMFFFEAVDGLLYCTAESGYPLVRYALKDRGGVAEYGAMRTRMRALGLPLAASVRTAGIGAHTWRLPFVHVCERDDFSVTLYGLNVYPEPVRGAVGHTEFERHVTGKCVLESTHDRRQNQYLCVHVEVRGASTDAVPAQLSARLSARIVEALHEANSEFRRLHESFPGRATPKVVLWPQGHPTYFRSGGKQRWVVKPQASSV